MKPLSPRERELVTLTGQGLTWDEVMDAMGIDDSRYITILASRARRKGATIPYRHGGPPASRDYAGILKAYRALKAEGETRPGKVLGERFGIPNSLANVLVCIAKKKEGLSR